MAAVCIVGLAWSPGEGLGNGPVARSCVRLTYVPLPSWCFSRARVQAARGNGGLVAWLIVPDTRLEALRCCCRCLKKGLYVWYGISCVEIVCIEQQSQGTGAGM